MGKTQEWVKIEKNKLPEVGKEYYLFRIDSNGKEIVTKPVTYIGDNYSYKSYKLDHSEFNFSSIKRLGYTHFMEYVKPLPPNIIVKSK